MSDELQNDEYVEETEVEAIQAEETDESESSELAADSDGEHEQKPDDTDQKQVNQDAVNEAINRQHRKYQEEKRRADELQKQLAQYAPKTQAPIVLESPDPFDDDYDVKQKVYQASRTIQLSARAI